MKSELSRRSKYWIDRHRYYELKHFCLQYPLWKKAYRSVDGLGRVSSNFKVATGTKVISNPTERCADALIFYADRMKLVEQAAFSADPELASYILKAVTEGRSYEYLKARLEIPCCRDTYYAVYRKFFWLLSKTRN